MVLYDRDGLIHSLLSADFVPFSSPFFAQGVTYHRVQKEGGSIE